jgi:hypothetical protein
MKEWRPEARDKMPMIPYFHPIWDHLLNIVMPFKRAKKWVSKENLSFRSILINLGTLNGSKLNPCFL